MYFWRIERLKADLAARPMTSREALPYFVMFVLMTELVALAIPLTTVNGWDWMDLALSVPITVLGTLYVYARNGGARGAQFLERYFAIGWVMTLRWLVGVMTLLIVLFAGLEIAGHASEETTWYETLLMAIAEIVLYWRIGQHVAEVAAKTGETETGLELVSG